MGTTQLIVGHISWDALTRFDGCTVTTKANLKIIPSNTEAKLHFTVVEELVFGL